MTAGKQIYRHHDEIGPLSVHDDGNRRYLRFGEYDEQSCQLKSEPFLLQHDYNRAMLLVLLFKRPKNMILFGLGGGTLATTLHQYLPDLNLRVVELRPQVVDVARRFFQFPRSKRVEVFVEDASEFLEREDQPGADVIFSDIFGEEGLDLQQTQPWFIESCQRLLKHDGWLVLNCWQQHRGDQAMMEALAQNFAELRVCTTVEGNWVILAGKKSSRLGNTQLKSSARKWSKQLGYSLAASLDRLNQIS